MQKGTNAKGNECKKGTNAEGILEKKVMITSVSNPKIKQVLLLKEKSKARREADAFVVEGIRMFREVPRESIKDIFVTEKFEEGNRTLLQGLRYEIVADEIFRKMSDTVTPQGILCTVKCFHYAKEEFVKKENGFFLLLEDIQDPGNLGTMFRTAEGAGIHGIIMSKGTVDIYNPKVVRSTMGAIFRMPFLYEEDLSALVQELRKNSYQIYAAALDGAVEYPDVQYTGGCGILIGNEGNGLSEALVKASSQPIFIPMEGKVESLNASISAAILMYHAKMMRDKK